MNKIFSAILLLLFSHLCDAQNYIDTVHLYTPNKSRVIATLYTEMSPYDIEYYTDKYVNEWPDAELLAPASALYNCHSYAWNMVERGRPICWLGRKREVWNYWLDNSYVETTKAYAEKYVWFHFFEYDYSAQHLYDLNF